MGRSIQGGFGRLTLFRGRTAAAPFAFIIRQPTVGFLASGEVGHAR